MFEMTRSVLLLLLFVCFSYGEVCRTKTDVGIIFEVPPKNPNTALHYAKLLLVTLQNDFISSDCIQFSVVIAGRDVDIVQKFSCQENLCRKISILQIESIAKKYKDGINGTSSKKQLASAIQNLKSLVFTKEKGSRSNARKLLVLILTSEKSNDITISDHVKYLHEQRFSVLAVGVGEGKYEDLLRISFEENRNLKLSSFGQLILGDADQKYSTLVKLILDPDYRDHVVSAPEFGYLVTNEPLDFGIYEFKDECKYAADIAFLVDSSKSIQLDYEQELQFVQTIAASFGITETETHAGVVVFSDASNYTKLKIKLNEYYDITKFNDAVSRLPFFGYRTRIDLAFDVTRKQLFTIQGGARPNIKKVIFLITDGNQFPTEENGNVYDPVKSSQSLYDDHVQIFVIGIGSVLEKKQLENIARDPSRVFYAKTIDKLLSVDFIKNVSQKLCSGGILGTTTEIPVNTLATKPPTRAPTESPTTQCNTVKPTGCKGVGECSTCCGKKEIYINIFQPGSGPKYVLQGLTISQSSNHGNTGSLSAVSIPPIGPKIDVRKDGVLLSSEEIIKQIQNLLPEHTDLIGYLKTYLPSKGVPSTSTENVRNRRKRRSTETGISQLSGLLNIAKASGCNLFIKDLQQQGVIKEAIQTIYLVKKYVTIFCPHDEAYKTYLEERNLTSLGNILLRHHVTFKHENNKMMYNSLDGQITLTPDHKQKPSWRIGDVHISFMLRDAQNGEVIVIDKVLEQPRVSLMEALRRRPDLSIMYELWKRMEINKMFKTKNVNEVCFTHAHCVTLRKDLREHLNEVLKFRQFTIQAPIDAWFLKMPNQELKMLYKNRIKRSEFIKKHVFMGILDHNTLSAETKVLGKSMLGKEISEMTLHKKKVFMVTSGEELYTIKQVLEIKEGLLQIIN